MVKAALLSVLVTLAVLNTPPTIPEPVILEGIIAYSYSLRVETIPGYVGEEGVAKIIFKPWAGFKWNQNYPSTLTMQKLDSDIATPLKQKLTKSEFISNKKGAVLCIPYKAKKEGRVKLKGVVNFSVCNEKECLVIRNKEINLSFIVLKNKE